MTQPIVLSFFPARFSHEIVTVWVGLWIDRDATSSLWARHPGLRTWRDGKSLYAWHPSADLADEFDGLSKVTVRFAENPRLFRRLTDEAVRRRLLECGFTQKGKRSYVNYSKGDLLAEIPSLAKLPTQLGIYRRIVPRTWLLEDHEGKPTCGLVIDVLYTTRIDISLQDWMDAGALAAPQNEGLILLPTAPEVTTHPELSGRIVGHFAGVRGAVAVIHDCNVPGIQELALSSVGFVPTRYTLERYLSVRYAREFATGKASLHENLKSLVQPAKRLEHIRMLKEKRLQSSDAPPLYIVPGVTVSFGDLATVGTPALPSRFLTSPEYSFDRAGDKVAKRVDEGLQKFGPFDSQVMSSHPMHLLVLAPADLQGQVEQAVRLLTQGMPKSNVFSGIRKMYRLGSLVVHEEYGKVDDRQPMAGYVSAVRSALKRDDTPFSTALVVIREKYRNLPDSENPYYQTKAQLLTLAHVPTQNITIETLRARPDSLQYIFNTIALALYAKMGGVSHVLRAPVDATAPTELVFGIGRAFTRASRAASEVNETIGFATVFRANGEYLYNDCTPYCKDEDYEVALEETILRAVARIAGFEDLKDGAQLRLIFHVPRTPGRRERVPILNAIRKLPQFKLRFAIVHVNEDHNLNLFQLPSAADAGATLPPRGLSVATGRTERLVTFVGPKQYRRQGLPVPLLLKLDDESTFTDIDYLTQQLYLFSFMSVGSLNPGIKPATISYAEQLADLTGHLRGVQQWTVDLITRELTTRLWFI